jgi:hypothetical protein
VRFRLLARWLLVALGLLVFDVGIREVFFPQHVVSKYVNIGLLRRERTNGHNWRAIFDATRRAARPALRIGIVGDSTVYGTVGLADETSPAWYLREALRERLGAEMVDVVDVSHIGLYANDATLLVNKLLALDVDVVIYGLTLRALPATPNARWATHLGSELSLSELVRVTKVGGWPWFGARTSAAELLASLVQSTWATYAYGPFLKRYAWEHVTRPLLRPWPTWLEATRPLKFTPPTISVPRDILPGAFEWTREGYGIPNTNWTALEVMGSLCERFGPGRCLIYSGPINPLGRDRLAAPGHYEEYLARLRVLVGRHRVRFRDFTDLLGAEDFRKPLFPRPGNLPPRDPIHMSTEGGAKFGEYLADAVLDLAAPRLRRQTAPTSRPPTANAAG